MNKPVYTFLNAYEQTELSDILYCSLNHRTNRIAILNQIPRVGFYLLQPQGYPLSLGVNLEYNCLDIISHINYLGGVTYTLCPRHFRYMD